ncbi:MAG: hypothetical protein ACREUB_09510 [Burkholderiales bacterium]
MIEQLSEWLATNGSSPEAGKKMGSGNAMRVRPGGRPYKKKGGSAAPFREKNH